VDLAPKDILLLPLARYQLRYWSLVLLARDSRLSPETPGQEGVCEVVFYPLERMPFGEKRSDFSISVNILHDLMESRGDDRVAMNP